MNLSESFLYKIFAAECNLTSRVCGFCNLLSGNIIEDFVVLEAKQSFRCFSVFSVRYMGTSPCVIS